MKCAKLTLQFDIITLLLYAEMLDVQQLHDRITSKKRFEVREKTIREFSWLSLWELNILIDSNKLESFIARYRRLFIRLRFYRSLDRSFVKNDCFIRRINISIYFEFFEFLDFNQNQIWKFENQFLDFVISNDFIFHNWRHCNFESNRFIST